MPNTLIAEATAAARAELGADFRPQYRQLEPFVQDAIGAIKTHAQCIVEHMAVAFDQVDAQGQSKLVTGTEHLETAVMWIVKGLSSGVNNG